MATRFVLDVATSDGNPWIASAAGGGYYRENLARVINVLKSLKAGTRDSTLSGSNNLNVRTSTSGATAVLTFASNPSAGLVVDVNGTEFVFVNGNPVAASNEVDQSSGTANTTAANFSAAVNACTAPSVSGVVTASVSTNVVTLTSVLSGALSNAPVVRVKGIMASGTVTVSGGAANDTAVINGVTFTAVSSNPTAVQYLVGSSDAATAANLAAALNASTNALVNQHVTARISGASSTVVTVKALYESLNGNCITLAATAHNTASGARLTGATEASADGAQASGQVTISSGSGTETATINGVAINVTWATSDANTAGLLAAAINSSVNALVQGIVYATAASNVVTVTSRMGGPQGNSITLAASGTGCTVTSAWAGGAVPSQITLSGAFGGWDPSLGGAHFTGGADTVNATVAL